MAIAQPNKGFLTLFKKRNFLRLWLAQLISMTILNATNYALIMLINSIVHSTTMIGLAIICFSVPAVLFGAPAGVFVDRMNKRRVLWASNCLRAIATIVFACILLANRSSVLIPIYLLTFVISAIGQFFTPAEGSAIPMLVDEDELMPALSLFNITFMLSQAIGYVLLAPIAISLLPTFRLFNIPIDAFIQLYAIIAVLYLICAALIVSIPQSGFAQREEPQAESTPDLAVQTLGIMHNIKNEMQQGWNFIRKRNALLLAVIQLSFVGVLILVIGQIATPIVTDLLKLNANLMALVFAPAGIGLVLGSIFMPRISRRLGKLRTILIGNIGLTIATLLLPVSTIIARWLEPKSWNTDPWLLVAMAGCMFVAGIALDFVNIPAQTAMQELTPDWIKGRVLALQLVLYNACSIPIILSIGALADTLHIDRVLYLLSASILIFCIWGVYYERKYPMTIKPQVGQLTNDEEAQLTTSSHGHPID
ncbi:MFS transporter [Dictyobacter kobayashii]|uniref:MFS transporter n=1 Tax=Dictyobacter kobayashii TaxID=2014872 RepID=A0A402AMS4_9CHLR|nr:MFS transporter [Dictyobacter kobayashii]GCE20300.1 MFS transporter [Dictyobacter kobayashii]